MRHPTCSHGNRYSGADCITSPIGGFEVTLNPNDNGGGSGDWSDDQ